VTLVFGRLIGAVAAVVMLATCCPAEGAVARFSAKIVGNSATGRVAKHAFVVGDGYTAVFRDNHRAGTSYRVCWYHRQRRVGCKAGKTGRVGRDDTVFLIAPGNIGRYDYRWIVSNRAVAHWTITIGVGD
jgi:hypothetical protein